MRIFNGMGGRDIFYHIANLLCPGHPTAQDADKALEKKDTEEL